MLAPLRQPMPEQRQSGILPDVKCSTCGQPVPLDRLGDHVCPPPPPGGAGPPPGSPAQSSFPPQGDRPRFNGPAAGPNAGRAPSPLRRDVSSPGPRFGPGAPPAGRPSLEGRPSLDGPSRGSSPGAPSSRPSFDERPNNFNGPPRPSFDGPPGGRPSMDELQRPRPQFDGPGPPGSPRFAPQRDQNASPMGRRPGDGPPPPGGPNGPGGPPFRGTPPGGPGGPGGPPPPGGGPFRGAEMMPLPPSPSVASFPTPASPRPSRAATTGPGAILAHPGPPRSPFQPNGPTRSDTAIVPPSREFTSSPMPDTTSGGSAGMAGVGRRAYFAEMGLPGPPASAMGMRSPGPGMMGPAPPGQPGLSMSDRRGNAPQQLPLGGQSNLGPGSRGPLSSSPGSSPNYPTTPRESPPSMQPPSVADRFKTQASHAPQPSDASDDVRLPWARGSPEAESPRPLHGQPALKTIQPLRPRSQSNSSKRSDTSGYDHRRQQTGDSESSNAAFAALMSRSDSMSTAGQREREDSDTDTLNQRSHNRSARDTHLSSGSDDVPPPTAAGAASAMLALDMRKMKGSSSMSESTYSAYSRATSMQSPQLKSLGIESVLDGFSSDEGKNTKLLSRLTPPPVPPLPPPETIAMLDTAAEKKTLPPPPPPPSESPRLKSSEKRTPPTRSKTAPAFPLSPTGSSGSSSTVKAGRSATTGRRKKDLGPCSVCAQQIVGRSVKGMCENCWKDAYLPKCHRCSKPIENRAISSSDGQLVGKYHAACFTCSNESCRIPLTGPESDGSFHVFEGAPFCEYHYHMANQSLCAAKSCGRPIDGPCIQVHDGSRYHPEHLVCGAPNCGLALGSEYWEVGGSMVCERHARSMLNGGEGSTLRPGADRSLNAMRRQTRVFDMGAGGIMGEGALGSIGEEDEEESGRSANDAARDAYLRSGPGVRRSQSAMSMNPNGGMTPRPMQTTFMINTHIEPATPTQASFGRRSPPPGSPDMMTPLTERDPFARNAPPMRSQTMGTPMGGPGGQGFRGPPPPPLGLGPNGNFNRPGPPGGFGGPNGPPSPGMRGPPNGGFFNGPNGPPTPRGPGFNTSPGPGPGQFNGPPGGFGGGPPPGSPGSGNFPPGPPGGFGGPPPPGSPGANNPNFQRGPGGPPGPNGFGGPGPGPNGGYRGPSPNGGNYGPPPNGGNFGPPGPGGPNGNFGGPPRGPPSPNGQFRGPPSPGPPGPGRFNGPPNGGPPGPGGYFGGPPGPGGNFNGPPGGGNFNGPPPGNYNGPPGGYNGPPGNFNGPPQPGFGGPPPGSPGNGNFPPRGPPPR